MENSKRKLIGGAVIVAAFSLTGCDKGEPTPGETAFFNLSEVATPPPSASPTPLDIINIQPREGPDEFAERLKRDGYRVEVTKGEPAKYRGITNNKINFIVLDKNLVTVKGHSGKDYDYGRIEKEISVKFVNGLVGSGEWTIDSIPSSSGMVLETSIKQEWADSLLRPYGFPALTGEEYQRFPMGGPVHQSRRDEEGNKCFLPDGKETEPSMCPGVSVTYEASFERYNHDGGREVCWHGVCSLKLTYFNAPVDDYSQQLNVQMAEIYKSKFGELDPK